MKLDVFVKLDENAKIAIDDLLLNLKENFHTRYGEFKKIFKAMTDGKKIAIKDVSAISWVWTDIYQYVLFTPETYKINQKLKRSIQAIFDEYIESYIDGKLKIDKINFLTFDNQKEFLLHWIQESDKIGLYGYNFILEKEFDESGEPKDNASFLLLQTLYTM